MGAASCLVFPQRGVVAPGRGTGLEFAPFFFSGKAPVHLPLKVINEQGTEMTIEERLEHCERELTATKRHTRWLMGGALMILGCLTIAATPGDKQIIRAQQFIVVDEQGRQRAMLGMYSNLSVRPLLSLSDEDGKQRAELTVFEDGTKLSLADGNGKTRIEVSTFKSGPNFSLYDTNDKNRVRLQATIAGHGLKNEARLDLSDANGKTIWSAP